MRGSRGVSPLTSAECPCGHKALLANLIRLLVKDDVLRNLPAQIVVENPLIENGQLRPIADVCVIRSERLQGAQTYRCCALHEWLFFGRLVV